MTDKRQIVANLLGAGERLIDRIEAENALLRARRTDGLAQLGDDKRQAARGYEEAFAAFLGAGPEAVFSSERGAKAALGRLAERLRQVGEENEQRLGIAVQASRRVLDAVAEAVKEISAGPKTYSRAGAYGAGRPARSAALAVSVDRTL